MSDQDSVYTADRKRSRNVIGASIIHSAYQTDGLSGAIEALSYLTEPTSLD
jgi:hypothetical protein